MASSPPTSRSLQIAQILADLNSLQNTDPTAARNLLHANKNMSPQKLRRKSKALSLPDPPKFDRLGRRIIATARSPPAPELKEEDTAVSKSSGAGSGGSPAAGSAPISPAIEGAEDTHLIRAKKLVALFERRDKLKQMGEMGLARDAERVERAF
ncbi:hypothetical protein B7494_g1981 [Chlorociboria aeruginascens]|nr:hypothetical protein B7494_g1981 [Chlorociboria aeruginascens]